VFAGLNRYTLFSALPCRIPEDRRVQLFAVDSNVPVENRGKLVNHVQITRLAVINRPMCWCAAYGWIWVFVWGFPNSRVDRV